MIIVHLTDYDVEMQISVTRHACNRLSQRTATYFKNDIEMALAAKLEDPDVADIIMNEIRIGDEVCIIGLLPGLLLPVAIDSDSITVKTVLHKTSSSVYVKDKNILDLNNALPVLRGGCCYA